jgi:hypothetical protein
MAEIDRIKPERMNSFFIIIDYSMCTTMKTGGKVYKKNAANTETGIGECLLAQVLAHSHVR